MYYKSDLEDRWKVRHGKSCYGYKVHVNADESRIARCVEIASANVHDSSKLRDLIDKKTIEAFTSDKVYDSQGIRS